MLGTKLGVRPFLERVGRELLHVDPEEIQALVPFVRAFGKK